MKLQKFYMWFCSLSWVVWLISIGLTEIAWHQSAAFQNTVHLVTLIPYLLSLTPTYTILSIIALIGSIKRKEKRYIAFNIISMIVTSIIATLQIICCAVFYLGGA